MRNTLLKSVLCSLVLLGCSKNIPSSPAAACDHCSREFISLADKRNEKEAFRHLVREQQNWIVKNSPAPLQFDPQYFPSIKFVSYNLLQFRWGKRHGYTIDGLHISRGKGKIFISNKFDYSPWYTSVLLHELVHNMQWYSGLTVPRHCTVLKEELAYQLQAKWYVDHGGSDNPPSIPLPVMKRIFACYLKDK